MIFCFQSWLLRVLRTFENIGRQSFHMAGPSKKISCIKFKLSFSNLFILILFTSLINLKRSRPCWRSIINSIFISIFVILTSISWFELSFLDRSKHLERRSGNFVLSFRRNSTCQINLAR